RLRIPTPPGAFASAAERIPTRGVAERRRCVAPRRSGGVPALALRCWLSAGGPMRAPLRSNPDPRPPRILNVGPPQNHHRAHRVAKAGHPPPGRPSPPAYRTAAFLLFRAPPPHRLLPRAKKGVADSRQAPSLVLNQPLSLSLFPPGRRLRAPARSTPTCQPAARGMSSRHASFEPAVFPPFFRHLAWRCRLFGWRMPPHRRRARPPSPVPLPVRLPVP